MQAQLSDLACVIELNFALRYKKNFTQELVSGTSFSKISL